MVEVYDITPLFNGREALGQAMDLAKLFRRNGRSVLTLQ